MHFFDTYAIFIVKVNHKVELTKVLLKKVALVANEAFEYQIKRTKGNFTIDF